MTGSDETELLLEVNRQDMSGSSTTIEKLGIEDAIELASDRTIYELSLAEINIDSFWSRRPTDPIHLWQLYHKEGLNPKQIAKELDVSTSTIYRWFERVGIRTQDETESLPTASFIGTDDYGEGVVHVIDDEGRDLLIGMETAVEIAEVVEQHETS